LLTKVNPSQESPDATYEAWIIAKASGDMYGMYIWLGQLYATNYGTC